MPSWNCCVMNCNNNTHGPLRFFSFPKDHERRQLWAESCGRANWFPTDLSRICEVHFDKSQFEQNQQDGTKLLKWSAIPRMYEEWTEGLTSPSEEHSHRSYEYDVTDIEEMYPDFDDMGNVPSLGGNFAEPELEGMLESEWSKTERLKRKRSAPYDELESEERQLLNTDKSEICVAKRGRKQVYPVERTDELEDELARIKADIKRLMEDTNTEKASDVYVRTDRRHISPTSAAMRRHSKFKEFKTSPGTIASPPSRNKHYLQETNSTSLQLRQRSENTNQSNKTSGVEMSDDSGRFYEISFSSVPYVAKKSVARVRQHPVEQLQRIGGIRKTGSNIIPSSQHPKRQIHSNVISKEVESTSKQNLNISAKREALLREIMDDTKPSPKRNSSDKPWRAPEELIQFMKNAVVCFAPGEKGTLSQIIEPRKTVKPRTHIIEALKVSPSKVGDIMQSSNLLKGTISMDKAETKSSLKSTAEAKSTLPRIVKVQSLNLLKDEAEMKGVPSRNGESQSSNSLKNETTSRISKVENKDLLKCPTVKKVIVPRFIKVPSVGLMESVPVPKSGDSQSRILLKGSKKTNETPPRIGEVESNNICIDTAIENESPPRILKEQKNSVTKDTIAVKETPLRISKQQRNSYQKDIMHVEDSSSETDETPSKSLFKGRMQTSLKTSKVKSKIALEETSENQNSPEVPVISNKEKSGSKTNGNVGVTPPETKSAQLKKLLASMLSLEEDMFSEESNLQAIEESKENTKKKKKPEVGVQTDDSQSEQVTELKEEITQLKNELEEKNKTIQQLQQSLAAILPPGQVIMLQSGNDENYMVFNQQDSKLN